MQLEDSELIDSSRISVVIQGLTHYVKDDKSCMYYTCIESIKKHLPHAEIIVSTWKGQECDESIVDKVIYNDEPESIIVDPFLNRKWNFNKMVVSTKNGINAAKREYVLKIRADLSLNNIDFFKIKSKTNIPEALMGYQIFKEPINISNIFVKTPLSYHHFLFHLSDIVQFGKKELMIDLWDRKIFDREMLITRLQWKSCLNYHCDTQERVSPEQALMIGWLGSYGYDINLPFTTYISRDYLKLSELMLSINFNMIDWDKCGINFIRRFIDDKKLLKEYIYTSKEFNGLYENYSVSVLNKRYISVLNNVYFKKWIIADFRSYFIRTFFIWVLSPTNYLKIREGWRGWKKRIVEKK